MNLEDIMLSEKQQSQKDKYYMIPRILVTLINQIHRDRKQSSGCQDVGLGKTMSWCFTSIEFQFCKMINFWRWMVVFAQLCECTYHYWTVHSKRVKIVNFTFCKFYYNWNKAKTKMCALVGQTLTLPFKGQTITITWVQIVPPAFWKFW